MTRQYPLAEARANLPAILDEVEAGGEVELTRRGKAVAMIISRRSYERLRSDQPGFGESYRAFLTRFPLEEVGADAQTFEGLRDRDVGRAVEL